MHMYNELNSMGGARTESELNEKFCGIKLADACCCGLMALKNSIILFALCDLLFAFLTALNYLEEHHRLQSVYNYHRFPILTASHYFVRFIGGISGLVGLVAV